MYIYISMLYIYIYMLYTYIFTYAYYNMTNICIYVYKQFTRTSSRTSDPTTSHQIRATSQGWGRIPRMGILHTAWALEVARYGARLTNQPFIAQLITSTKQRVGAQLHT